MHFFCPWHGQVTVVGVRPVHIRGLSRSKLEASHVRVGIEIFQTPLGIIQKTLFIQTTAGIQEGFQIDFPIGQPETSEMHKYQFENPFQTMTQVVLGVIPTVSQ